jgi:hypothetical protein
VDTAPIADLLLGQSVALACSEEIPRNLGGGIHAADHLVR